MLLKKYNLLNATGPQCASVVLYRRTVRKPTGIDRKQTETTTKKMIETTYTITSIDWLN